MSCEWPANNSVSWNDERLPCLLKASLYSRQDIRREKEKKTNALSVPLSRELTAVDD